MIIMSATEQFTSEVIASVKKVLEELHAVFGGFMASDTEDLEPIFEIADF